jgi:hypothetical protein
MKSLVAALTIVALALTTSPAAAAPRPHALPRAAGHPGAFEAHRGVASRHEVGRDRDFDRREHDRVFVATGPAFFWGSAYPYLWDVPAVPVYAPPPPSYWYYCPSAGAYYPYVSSCPEAWLPVPATLQ